MACGALQQTEVGIGLLVEVAHDVAVAVVSGVLCRGMWGRVTIDRFRHLSLSAFKQHMSSADTLSAQFRTFVYTL